MLKLVSRGTEIGHLQRQFRRTLITVARKSEVIRVGWRGGADNLRVSWSPDLDFWWRIDNEIGGRSNYWNTFGSLRDGQPLSSIDCEVNIAPSKIDRRVSGAFAADASGGYFLVHRGRIGGGRKGIGKQLFLNNYQGKWLTVQSGSATENVALVGDLESERFPHQLANFVGQVRKMKLLRRSRSSSIIPKARLKSLEYNPEFTGKRASYSTKSQMEPEADHGLIVDDLEKQLRSRGFQTGNRGFVDLYARKRGRSALVFEVKTSDDLGSCYTATGQLLFNSIRLGGNPKKIGVFPDTIRNTTKDILSSIGVSCLTYHWRNNKPILDPRLLSRI